MQQEPDSAPHNNADSLAHGCSRCRFARNGCSRCRNPTFQPRHPNISSRSNTTRRTASSTRKNNNNARQRRSHPTPSLSQTLRHHLSAPSSLPPLPSSLLGKHTRDTTLDLHPHKYIKTTTAEPQSSSQQQQQHTTAAGIKRHANSQQHIDKDDPLVIHPPLPPPSKYIRTDHTYQHITDDIEMLEADDGDDDDGQSQQNLDTSPPSPIRSTQFLAKLEDNMQRRKKARLESAEDGVVLQRSPLSAALEKLSPARKKQKTTNLQRNTRIDPRVSLWHPPPSPFGLLEEELYSNPWKLLVSCMLLNKTTASQVRTVIWKLFSTYPTPEAAIAANTTDLEVLLRPLGLFRKRALAMQKLSEEYLNLNWQRPEELHGIGKYAADAYYIFCRNEWRDVQPEDKDLKKYRDWLEETDGLGAGYQRVLRVE